MKFSLKNKIKVVALIVICTGSFPVLSGTDDTCENFVAKEINLKNNNGIEDVRYWENLLSSQKNIDKGNHPNIGILLNNVGAAYCQLQDEESVQKGIKYLEESFTMHQELKGEANKRKSLVNLEKAIKIYEELFDKNNIDKAVYIANHLNDIGVAYHKLHLEKVLAYKDIQKSVWYYESALRIYMNIYDGKDFTIFYSLWNLAYAYTNLGDGVKGREYLKQAFSICVNMCLNMKQEDCKAPDSTIELIRLPHFTKNEQLPNFKKNEHSDGNRSDFEYRQVISVRGKPNAEIIILKQQFKSLLANIIKAVDDHGWSYIGYSYNDWGVKGYIGKKYINAVWKTYDTVVGALKQLSSADDFSEFVTAASFGADWEPFNAIGSVFASYDNSKNIELVQMLCFESMNLGILRSEKKPYEIVKSFTRENPKLVKKIAVEHPDFFVDGSIVKACIEALPEDKSFEQHILAHVRFLSDAQSLYDEYKKSL